MYLLIQKSMQLHLFIHLARKRAETIALLDSGATENFLKMHYTKEMHFPIKRLERPRPVYNVDRTRNKNGDIEHYTDLEMQTGTQRTWLRFFLTDLGEQKVILGYPWFAATQPKIDWARGWLESDQLPLILCTRIASQTRIGKCAFTPAGRRAHIKRPPKIVEPLYMAQILFPEATGKKQTLASKLAEKAGSQKGNGKIPAK